MKRCALLLYNIGKHLQDFSGDLEKSFLGLFSSYLEGDSSYILSEIL